MRLKIYINKKILKKKYIKEKKSIVTIAKELKLGRTVVYNRLKDYNIPIRNEASFFLHNHKICQCFVCQSVRKEFIGEKNTFYGKKHTKETIKKIRNSDYHKNLKGKKKPEGWGQKEKNPNWKGGLSFEEYGLEFDNPLKEQVRFRDGYKCKLCGCSQLENAKQLDVHHIDYNKKNVDINNLISLCRSCHIKTNYNRTYWQEYFTKKEVIKI